ncbi:MAG: hypothetical protein IJO32_00665 [Bacilli bacterium]|nr:hypothetical protein [Bacilli bacterium]
MKYIDKPHDFFNSIEQKILSLTNQVKKIDYGYSKEPIPTNNDFSNKKLILNFSENLWESILEEAEYEDYVSIISSENYIIKEYIEYLTNYNVYHIELQKKDGTRIATLYMHASEEGWVQDINLTEYTLPNDFGTVNYVNTYCTAYNSIKYEKKITMPDYINKVWVYGDFLYIQEVDRIEQGIENLGLWFTKPSGWINSKTWIVEGTELKTFSKVDYKRWLNNLNLIEYYLQSGTTLWNSKTTYINWNEKSNEEWM